MAIKDLRSSSGIVGVDSVNGKTGTVVLTAGDIGIPVHALTIPVKYEITLSAVDISNMYIDLPSAISPASTEDVEVIGSPDGFRNGVDYTVITNNRIDWSLGGSLLLSNLESGDVMVVQYERL